MIVEKFNPVYQSKQVACVVLTTAIANIDCKYMKFCAWDMYRSYMLAPRDFFWNQFKKCNWFSLKLSSYYLWFWMHFLQCYNAMVLNRAHKIWPMISCLILDCNFLEKNNRNCTYSQIYFTYSVTSIISNYYLQWFVTDK